MQTTKITVNKRINSIDIYRGIGVALMVLGHIGLWDFFDKFIHAFHMPMFFMISGFLFNHIASKENIGKRIIKKSKSLLIPYIVFGLLHYVVLLFKKDFEIVTLKNLFWTNTKGLYIAGALWFLTALYLTDIIILLLNKYVKIDALRHIIVLAITLFGCFYKTLIPVTLPFAIGPAMVGTGLFYIGLLIKQNKEKKIFCFILNMPWWFWLVCTAVTTALIFINQHINMRKEQYGNILLFFIVSTLSFLIIISFSVFADKHFGKSFICRWLSGIGRNSIIYVCLNQLVIMIVKDVCNIITGSSAAFVAIRLALIIFGTFALLQFLVFLFKNTKMKICLGEF